MPAQSSEGGTALRGGLVVGKLPTSLEGKGEKVDVEELILCYKLGRFRKAREMAIVFLSQFSNLACSKCLSKLI